MHMINSANIYWIDQSKGILLMANEGSKGGVGTSGANGSRNNLTHQGKF